MLTRPLSRRGEEARQEAQRQKPAEPNSETQARAARGEGVAPLVGEGAAGDLGGLSFNPQLANQGLPSAGFQRE